MVAALLENLFTSFLQPRPGRTQVRIQGTRPAAQALVTALLADARPRSVLALTATLREAEELAEELRFFCGLFTFGSGREREAGSRQVLLFPPGLGWPLGSLRVSADSIQDRLRTLLRLVQGQRPCTVVAPVDALLERVPPQQVLANHGRVLRPAQRADRDELAGFLLDTGYRRVPVVEEPGEFAVRGSLIDLYPLTAEVPFRVDFFGDSIEAVRTFDPETQRSREPVPSASVPPAGLYVERACPREDLRRRLKDRADALDMRARSRIAFLARLDAGLPSQELATLIPFCYPKLETLLEYLDPDALILPLDPEGIRRTAETLEAEVEQGLERLFQAGRIPPAPEDLYLRPELLWQRLRESSLAVFSDLPLPGGWLRPPAPPDGAPGEPGLDSEGGAEPAVVRLQCRRVAPQVVAGQKGQSTRGLAAYVRPIREWIGQGQRVYLVCGTEPEKARIAGLLEDYGLDFIQPGGKLDFWQTPPGLYLLRGALSEGFLLPAANQVFLHEEDIFGRKVRRPRVSDRAAFRGMDVRELKPGDFVVHVDFGIGRYLGLETLDIRGLVNDYLHLEYAGRDKLYLPVDRASRIQRYVSTEEAPPALDKLGSTAWARTKQKVRESILAMAAELVSIYAARAVKKGFSFSRADASYHEFEATFPYEETPDQMRAIDDVVSDMERDRPMDRLVCGDVGFGKTEVAIRAAYKAVMDGKQVAVLVPTTVLAQQHFVNFRRRFEQHPIAVEMLSRFRSTRQQKSILEALARGTVDVVVGTHRLLQQDVLFRDLGLLIVDEEHRFGVRHKEKLKKMRTEVDVLTLTATPIPRTLHMSLLGIRDLSVIQTPPQDRHAIETYIVPFQPDVIRAAVSQELERGGQVFFVHNQVYDIGAVAERLQQIVPEARIAIAHGQMPERELERVMLEFVECRHDVLLCTTIIESGLDIQNANTLLVNRADRFGLAQLYQLRGRVGRAERQAYAYLIVPDDETLAGDARERLEALYEFTELGSGFRIARYDLEIRGAGNLLGASQSGQIRAVGYDLYLGMMEKAVRELKGEEVIEEVDPEIHLEMPAYLPQEYIPDSTQRLSFYKRLASAREEAEVEGLREELVDRFGPLSEQAENLLGLIRIKVRLRRLRVRDARLSDEGLLLTFDPQTPVHVERILQWAAREPERLRLYPDDRLLIRFVAAGQPERLDVVHRLLGWLEEAGSRPRRTEAGQRGNVR
ncbi:MAG: transcription-repair coupling factor [bacterium]